MLVPLEFFFLQNSHTHKIRTSYLKKEVKMEEESPKDVGNSMVEEATTKGEHRYHCQFGCMEIDCWKTKHDIANN